MWVVVVFADADDVVIDLSHASFRSLKAAQNLHLPRRVAQDKACQIKPLSRSVAAFTGLAGQKG
jgi:hypothetical protein